MRRHRRGMEPLTEINVTNLLDTAFVLLMAFMIVAPSMNHGVNLQLPTVVGAALETQKTVNIQIQKKQVEGGTEGIFVDDRRLSLEDLNALLVTMKKQFAKLDVIMEVDKSVSYDTFAKALGTVKLVGIDNVGLLTEPPIEPKTK